MRVVYESTIGEKVERAIIEAKGKGRGIECIFLSSKEYNEFLSDRGYVQVKPYPSFIRETDYLGIKIIEDEFYETD